MYNVSEDINNAEVEQAGSSKFLRVHITEDLSWTLHTSTTLTLLPEKTLEVWYELQHPHQLIGAPLRAC